MGDLVAVVAAVLLLLGNAFFVGAEFSLVSARRTQIEPKAAGGSRAARITLRAIERVSLMMAGAQLGITVCSLGLGALGEPAVAHLLEGPLGALGLPEGLLHPIAFAISLLIVVSLHMVIGEMVPKNIALAGPDRAALILGPPLYGLVMVLRPITASLNWLANHLLRVVKVQPTEEVASTFSAEEVAGFVHESHQEGLLDEDERHLLEGALDFVGTTVSAVLIPLEQLITLPSDVPVEEAQRRCAETGYSRFPVRDADGGICRYVHVKDLLDLPGDSQQEAVPADRLRHLVDVRSGDPLRTALTEMQGRGAHLARVLDEDGTLVGVAALEDVIETLVGEVQDATRQDAPPVPDRQYAAPVGGRAD